LTVEVLFASCRYLMTN